MLPAGLARATASRVFPALRALPGLHTLPARALHIPSAHSASCSSRFTSALRAFREPAFCKPFAAPRRTISTTWPSLAKAIAKAKAGKPKAEPLPTLSPPAVGGWLLLSAGLVFTIIVVGGVTRLTESGLSITEWKPISGIMPPLNQQQWDEEFDKYKASPEYKIMNSAMDLDGFKRIFYMEWGHRVLGRVIGVAFMLPFGYFLARGVLTRHMPARLAGMTLLIGVQGALGWYMVKSGLEDELLHTPSAVPRVSQYRLAAHLGTAFVLYGAMFWNGIATMQDWRFAKGRMDWVPQSLSSVAARRFRIAARSLTGLVFLTAMSGAFVAGLDAGLLYNEFPLMGGRIAPPTNELFAPEYSKQPHESWWKSDLLWRNMLENPVTVQFDHRVLAVSTYLGIGTLWASTMLRPALRAALPKATARMLHSAFFMANVQVALGISTLLYLVPVPLAACHQAGSVMLLTTMLHLLLTMRAPSGAARAWRQAMGRAPAAPAKAAPRPATVIPKMPKLPRGVVPPAVQAA